MIEYVLYLIVGLAIGAIVAAAQDTSLDDIHSWMEEKHKEAIKDEGEVCLEVVAKSEEEDKHMGIVHQQRIDFRAKEWKGAYYATSVETNIYTDGNQSTMREDKEELLIHTRENLLSILPEGDEIEADVRTDDEELKSEIVSSNI